MSGYCTATGYDCVGVSRYCTATGYAGGGVSRYCTATGYDGGGVSRYCTATGYAGGGVSRYCTATGYDGGGVSRYCTVTGYDVVGLDQLPQGGGLIVYYHGAIPLDAYYLVARAITRLGRHIHCVGDRFLQKIPGHLLLTDVIDSYIRLPATQV